MQEACTLKTREYTARGLPFIIGHRDPDLVSVPSDRRFFLSVPPDDSPVDIDRVISFARSLNDDEAVPALAKYMRAYAFAHLDWKPKVQRYVDFCESVLARD